MDDEFWEYRIPTRRVSAQMPKPDCNWMSVWRMYAVEVGNPDDVYNYFDWQHEFSVGISA